MFNQQEKGSDSADRWNNTETFRPVVYQFILFFSGVRGLEAGPFPSGSEFVIPKRCTPRDSLGPD